MAFTQDFSVSQTVSDPSVLTIDDTSTGSGPGIITRYIYLRKADGDYLVPTGTSTDYIVWLYSGGNTLDIDVLDVDYALEITIEWRSNSAVLYTKTETYCFTLYAETFDYSLTQDQAGNPNIVRDVEYFGNRMKLRNYIDAAEKAVQYGDDIYSAQRCLDAAKDMIDNENLYF